MQEAKSYKGYIQWYDNKSGDGMVKIPELGGQLVYMYKTATECKNPKERTFYKRKYEHFENKDPVEVKLVSDFNWVQVSECKKSNWTTKENLESDELAEMLDASIRLEHDIFKSQSQKRCIDLGIEARLDEIIKKLDERQK